MASYLFVPESFSADVETMHKLFWGTVYILILFGIPIWYSFHAYNSLWKEPTKENPYSFPLRFLFSIFVAYLLAEIVIAIGDKFWNARHYVNAFFEWLGEYIGSPLAFILFIAFFIFTIGGAVGNYYWYLNTRGNPQNPADKKNALINAIIGAVVGFALWKLFADFIHAKLGIDLIEIIREHTGS